MGREIISLSAGQAGNQLGTAFWENILQEHGLDYEGKVSTSNDLQTAKLDVYFEEAGNKKYVPRSIQVDLEPAVLDTVRAGRLGHLFRPDTFIHSQSGAGNNWAKGYYTEGAELVDGILDVARAQSERCDSLQGFQLLHSLGGGTGSGLGALLLGKIREEFPDRMLSTYSIFPSPKVSDVVVEPYNCILSTHNLVENSDVTVCLDNEALYDVTQKVMKQSDPSYQELNAVIARVMSGITTTLRFPGTLNGDLRKLATNMVPFPRLHFFSVGYAPLVANASKAYQTTNVRELTAQLFDRRSWLAAVDPALGKYMTTSIAYRGKLQSSEVEREAFEYQDRHSALFVPWVPTSNMTTLCAVPPLQGAASATLVANTTSISELFKRSHEQFARMWKRKAFVHWYTGEGMDELEFTEAESNLIDLSNEYDQYANADVDDGDYDEQAGEEGGEFEN